MSHICNYLQSFHYSIEADDIVLASIQALYELSLKKDKEIEQLQSSPML